MEKTKAVIIDARCAAMRRARINVNPTSSAAALSPFITAFSGGRNANPHAAGIRRRMHVNQPEQKQRGRGADGQDRRNRWAGAATCVPKMQKIVIRFLSASAPQCFAIAHSISVVISSGRYITLTFSRSRASDAALRPRDVVRKMRAKRMVYAR